MIREAIEKIHSGYLGDVYMTRGVCFKWRDTIGHAAVEPVPAGVDYDLWTGPAPVKPFTRNRFHYNWHWNYLYGNGDMGNQGVHQLDAARWALGAGFPNKVSAIGGHFMFDDDQDTPNDLVCAFEFGAPGEKGGEKHRMISFEVRHWITNHEAGIGTPDLGAREHNANSVGNVVYGSKGYLSIADEDTGAYKAWLGREQEPQPGAHENSQTAHFKNFVDCIISRKKEDLHAPIEEGHISGRPDALGQRVLPVGTHHTLQPRNPGGDWGCRSQCPVARWSSGISQAVRRSGEGLSSLKHASGKNRVASFASSC